MAEEEQATADSAVEEGATAVEQEPTDAGTLSLEGHKLDEMGGSRVGRISGVLAGESGEPEWLIARMGRFGHFCMVPARDAVSANGRVWVPYSRDQIRRAPKVDPSAPPPDELKQATLEHYGLGAPA